VSMIIELFLMIKNHLAILPFVYFVLIMPWSMSKMMSLLSVPKMELVIRLPAFIHPNKMELLNTNIDIFWMSLGL